MKQYIPPRISIIEETMDLDFCTQTSQQGGTEGFNYGVVGDW